MLGSITPLGERGRGSRWWLTVSAYLAGSAIGGAVAGAVAGTIGAAIGAGGWAVSMRLVLLAVALLAGIALDLGVAGVRLPTVSRQVDEEWRGSYRGWVWGLAFGFQLALGVVTVVTTSTVYVTWIAAALTGSPAAGAAIGVAFGVARALPIFAVAGVRDPGQLLGVGAALDRFATPARRTAYAAGVVLAAASATGAAR
jgi:hypothetical protein